VQLSCRYAWPTILSFLLLAVISATYFTRHFAIITDSKELLSSSLAWRQQEKMLHDAFPQRIDQIIAVIDATTPEGADDAAEALVNGLASRPDVIRSVSRPDGGEFFERDGILLLGLDEVQHTTADLIAAQPFLRRCAASFIRCLSRSRACDWGKQSWKISNRLSLRWQMHSNSWEKARPPLSRGVN
jgi:hypothetical protein